MINNKFRDITVSLVSLLGCLAILTIDIGLPPLKFFSTVVTVWVLVALPKKSFYTDVISKMLIQRGLVFNKTVEQGFNEAFIPMFAAIPSAFLLMRFLHDNHFTAINCSYILLNIFIISFYLLLFTGSFMPESLKHRK